MEPSRLPRSRPTADSRASQTPAAPPQAAPEDLSFDAALPTEPPTARVVALQTASLPVFEEEVHVDKRLVETARVRITKAVRTRQQEVNVGPLEREQVRVERVPLNQPVDRAPEVRQEGDTTIIPVVEEVLVVEKRLILREEIRVTRTRTQELAPPERVLLRSEEVHVERVETSPRSEGRGG